MNNWDDALYREIKVNVLSLYQRLGFYHPPVDAATLALTNNIQLLPYQSGFDENELSDLLFIHECPSGVSFSLQTPYGPQRITAYNANEPDYRVRFTLLHEIGHSSLHHMEDSPVAEKQANFFAGYAIAPPMLISLMGLTTAKEIRQTFGVSLSCADLSLKRAIQWEHHKEVDMDITNKFIELYNNGLALYSQHEQPQNVFLKL